MKIKNGFDLYGKSEVIDLRGVVVLDENGREAFEITLKNGELRISCVNNPHDGIRGILVIKPVVANVIQVGRE